MLCVKGVLDLRVFCYFLVFGREIFFAFWQKQSYKFAQRGCPRANLDLLTQIFSLGSKRFASFFTLFLLSAFAFA